MIPGGSTDLLAADTGAPQRGIKDDIAEAILSIRYESLEKVVVEQAKRVFLYATWTSFLGRNAQYMNSAIGFSMIEYFGNPAGPCTVIGHNLRVTALDAAYLNCMLIGGGGYDDVIFPAGVHAGLMVVPAAMAIAEQERRSGRDFLAAIVVGYEILGKIGRWTWTNESPRRPGPVFGPMAAAGVAARLLRLDQNRTAAAIGYAAHGAMGLPCQLNTHLHAMACRTGIISALYAKAGGACPTDIIEGELGFFQTFFSSRPASAQDVLEDFGTDLAILRSREKRYPGTLLNLVAVEKTRELVHAHGLTAENVKTVSLQLSSARSRHPTAQLRPPYRTGPEAFASCQFLIALLLLDGDIIEDRRKASKDDPEVLEVAGRVLITFVESKNPIFARVVIQTINGRQFAAQGEDHVFPSLDAISQLEKYASDTLSRQRIRDLVETVWHLEDCDDVSEVLTLLTPDNRNDSGL